MKNLFPTVGWGSGYDRHEVDEFFTRARSAYEDGTPEMDADEVRTVAFALSRGGYDPTAVDAALDRLEAAFVQRRRADFIAEHGQDAWMDHVAQRATTLYPRLVRPAGERFAPPAKGRGYACEAVDELMESLVEYFDAGRSLTAAHLRHATFATARRSRAYAEGPVDAFLDRAVDVLLAVE